MSKKHKKWNNKWKKNWNWKAYSTKPQLVIEPQAYEKLMYYVQMARGEISGLGKIRYAATDKTMMWKAEKIYLEDIELFTQECTYGGTTLQDESLSKFIVSLIRRKQNPHDWRLWWHSHVDFGASWSGIDEAAIRKLTAEVGSELISVCADKSYHMVARRDINGGKKHEELATRVKPRMVMSTYNKCEREFKEKLTHVNYNIAPIYSLRDRKFDRHNVSIIDVRREINTPLLEYKGYYRSKNDIKIITDREATRLGIHYDPCTGLFMRISDGKILTEREIRLIGLGNGENDELHASIGHSRTISSILERS